VSSSSSSSSSSSASASGSWLPPDPSSYVEAPDKAQAERVWLTTDLRLLRLSAAIHSYSPHGFGVGWAGAEAWARCLDTHLIRLNQSAGAGGSGGSGGSGSWVGLSGAPSWGEAEASAGVCAWEGDGECDAGGVCLPGTDSWDCSGWNASDGSCTTANDGVCDEGNSCPYGSDSADCWDDCATASCTTPQERADRLWELQPVHESLALFLGFVALFALLWVRACYNDVRGLHQTQLTHKVECYIISGVAFTCFVAMFFIDGIERRVSIHLLQLPSEELDEAMLGNYTNVTIPWPLQPLFTEDPANPCNEEYLQVMRPIVAIILGLIAVPMWIERMIVGGVRLLRACAHTSVVITPATLDTPLPRSIKPQMEDLYPPDPQAIKVALWWRVTLMRLVFWVAIAVGLDGVPWAPGMHLLGVLLLLIVCLCFTAVCHHKQKFGSVFINEYTRTVELQRMFKVSHQTSLSHQQIESDDWMPKWATADSQPRKSQHVQVRLEPRQGRIIVRAFDSHTDTQLGLVQRRASDFQALRYVLRSKVAKDREQLAAVPFPRQSMCGTLRGDAVIGMPGSLERWVNTTLDILQSQRKELLPWVLEFLGANLRATFPQKSLTARFLECPWARSLLQAQQPFSGAPRSNDLGCGLWPCASHGTSEGISKSKLPPSFWLGVDREGIQLYDSSGSPIVGESMPHTHWTRVQQTALDTRSVHNAKYMHRVGEYVHLGECALHNTHSCFSAVNPSDYTSWSAFCVGYKDGRPDRDVEHGTLVEEQCCWKAYEHTSGFELQCYLPACMRRNIEDTQNQAAAAAAAAAIDRWGLQTGQTCRLVKLWLSYQHFGTHSYLCFESADAEHLVSTLAACAEAFDDKRTTMKQEPTKEEPALRPAAKAVEANSNSSSSGVAARPRHQSARAQLKAMEDPHLISAPRTAPRKQQQYFNVSDVRIEPQKFSLVTGLCVHEQGLRFESALKGGVESASLPDISFYEIKSWEWEPSTCRVIIELRGGRYGRHAVLCLKVEESRGGEMMQVMRNNAVCLAEEHLARKQEAQQAEARLESASQEMFELYDNPLAT
jgi:hypothetical protein